MAEFVGRDRAAHRLRTAAERSERRRQWEVSREEKESSSREIEPTVLVPVMDMRLCINNLDTMRMEAGSFPLKEFSDYWAPDNQKTTPNKPSTFVPNRLVSGTNPLWAPFYDGGQTRLGSDGSMENDPDDPPFFRVSAELLGRSLHIMKRRYVDDDEKRKTDKDLCDHIESLTLVVKGKMTDAGRIITDGRENLLRKHEELMATTHDRMAEASRLYREAVDKHVATLQMSVQSGAALAQDLKLGAKEGQG